MLVRKLLFAPLLLVAGQACAQVAPQWRYSNLNGVPTVAYQGNVLVQGSLTTTNPGGTQQLGGGETYPNLTSAITGGGSTWPFQDMNFKIRQYGTSSVPLVPSISGGAFLTPEFSETFVGANHTGGVQGGLDLIQMRGAANGATSNRNYVARQLFASATTSDGGTGVTMATGAGQLFGLGSLAVLYAGATNWLNVTGGEINVQASATSSVAYKSVLQLGAMPQDAVQGSAYDAVLSISNQVGAVGFKNGILFSSANGQNAVSSTGCILCVADSPAVANGVNLTGATFSAIAFASPGFSVSGAGAAVVLQVTLGKSRVGLLPTCNAGAEGTLAAVTDANSATFNAALVGGGANHVMAYCNGSGWTVH